MPTEILPVEIQKAILRIAEEGESAKVKLDRGTWKVHKMSLKLECSKEADGCGE